jgi:N-acetylmuramic acid 6-phosphate etherase
MDTERPSPRYTDIDLWEPADVLDAMIEGQFAAVAAVRATLPAIERAALAMEARLSVGGRLIYAGAGTSGRLAVQDGAELMPTFSWPRERLVLLIAGGDQAMVQAVEGAEDEIGQAAALMRRHCVDGSDVLIAVAASGTTPFTLACMRAARQRGSLTIGIANNPDTPLLLEPEQAIFLQTGAEPIAGSTRMNAGTAQRITLNLLSTLVMIRLGHVYRGLMVDVHAANLKLTKRKEEMLVYLTGRNRKEAREAIVCADGSVKLAVLLLHGGDLEKARTILAQAGGRLRIAVDLLTGRNGPTSTADPLRNERMLVWSTQHKMPTSLKWLAPWYRVEDGEERRAIENELRREICDAHALAGEAATLLARRGDMDEALFLLSGGRVAEVHLTWSPSRETDPRCPTTTFYDSLDHWVEQSMVPLHAWFGDTYDDD